MRLGMIGSGRIGWHGTAFGAAAMHAFTGQVTGQNVGRERPPFRSIVR